MFITKRLLIAAPMVLTLCSGSQADIMDFSDMIADVSTVNTGQELITPQFRELNQGEGSCTSASGCFSIRFKISTIVPTNVPKSALHLYYTPEKILSYPSCGSDETTETNWEPKFVRVGKTMTAGFNVSSSCASQDAMPFSSYEKNTAYLYMTNVSAASGTTKVYSYPASQLLGLNTAGNLNAKGSGTDLMATLNYIEGTNAGKLQIDVFEPTTYSRYIADLVIADR